MNSLDFLVIHCTATPKGRKVTDSDIRKWHLSPKPEGRGWKQVGYSDMIYLDGSLVNLTAYNQDNVVDPWEITNGAVGVNQRSRHVVYVGGLGVEPELENDDDEDMGQFVPEDTRTPEQLKSLELYVKYMILRHPRIKVAGHNQFANKACPSFDVVKWARSVGISEYNIYIK